MELAGLNIRNRQGKKDIEDAVAKIFGTKSFDYVTYELLGETEPFRLVINCTKGPIHQFGASYRFDTEEVVSALLNLGLNTHRLQGSALDLTGKVSINPMADIHYYYKLPTGPAINYNFHYKLQNNNLFDVSHIKFKASFHNLRNEIWLSNLNWKSFDVKFGAMHDFYSIYSVLSNSDFKDYTLDKQGHNFISFFANASADTFDNGYFPTKGSKMKINYQWGIAGLNSTLDPFHIVSINYKGVAKKGKIFTILPSIDLRLILNSAVPLEYANIIGGTLAGRYLDQQIPFIGINNAAILPPLLGQAGLDFRVNFAKNNYITATAQGGITGATMDEIFTKSRTTFAGFGLEYAYNSFLGPLKMNVHWSTFTHKVGAYVGLGFDF